MTRSGLLWKPHRAIAVSAYLKNVPSEVIEFYETLAADCQVIEDFSAGKSDLGHLDYFSLPSRRYVNEGLLPWYPVDAKQLEALHSCMIRREMLDVWETINQRTSDAPPVRFAVAIMAAHQNMSEPYPLGDREEIELHKSAATRIRKCREALIDMFDPDLSTINPAWNHFKKSWTRDHPRFHEVYEQFNTHPITALESLANWFDREAELIATSSMEAWAGQPKRDTAPAHFFVRKLSQHMSFLYGQPLHDVVTAVTTVVTDDTWDISRVTKLVNIWKFDNAHPLWREI